MESGRKKSSEYLFWCVKSCQFSVKMIISELDNSERTNETSRQFLIREFSKPGQKEV